MTTLASFGALTDRACPSCGMHPRTTLLEDQYLVDAPADKMSLVECRGCALIYTAPIPTPAWNQTYVDRHGPSDGIACMDAAWQEEHESGKFTDGLAVLRPVVPAGRLLDVGTGPGLFVRLARAAGYEAFGYDTLMPRTELATVPMVQGPLSEQPPGSYDIVTLWCVVAHEPDFMSLLADCHRLLRRGGTVLIETPNMTLWRKLYRGRRLLERLSLRRQVHDAVAAYGHINHFTTSTLSVALIRRGFQGVRSHRIRSYGQSSVADSMKRLLHALSGGRINVCHPLVMTAEKA